MFGVDAHGIKGGPLLIYGPGEFTQPSLARDITYSTDVLVAPYFLR
ncbi:hypothetical protein [Streptomyces violaceusniger]